MEAVIEVPTRRRSLSSLNEYYLLDILEFLDTDDLINLAKTSNRLKFVADRIFKIRSKLVRVDSEMIHKGKKYIDHLFQHIGPHVTSLDFTFCYRTHRNSSKILGSISNKCENLKNLKCFYMDMGISCDGGVQQAYSFDDVELLILYFYSDKFDKHFTKSFHRLKSVNIKFSSIEFDELKTIFQNNRSIESFVYNVNTSELNCQLLELIPNVERLSLMSASVQFKELDSLLRLNRLTKLKLQCEFSDVKNVLRELATKGLIEELELLNAAVDEDFFDTLASFSKLQLFVLQTRGTVQLKSSISWPAQLKKLRLYDCELTKNHLIAMIQQLESIESIDIGQCKVSEDDIRNLNNVARLSREICNIIYHNNRKQRLDVVLPLNVRPPEPPKEHHFLSERLRILHYRHDISPLQINIYFPGF